MMNSQRAIAYRQVMHTLHELGPSKLLAEEQDQIRSAADTLIFSADPQDDASALQALSEIDELCRKLVDSGRWERVTAARLAGNVAACGMLPALSTEAA
jgi:hypothetical protein